jgi:hypothetical protein
MPSVVTEMESKSYPQGSRLTSCITLELADLRVRMISVKKVNNGKDCAFLSHMGTTPSLAHNYAVNVMKA